jgi:hypothetical protein
MRTILSARSLESEITQLTEPGAGQPGRARSG